MAFSLVTILGAAVILLLVFIMILAMFLRR